MLNLYKPFRFYFFGLLILGVVLRFCALSTLPAGLSWAELTIVIDSYQIAMRSGFDFSRFFNLNNQNGSLYAHIFALFIKGPFSLFYFRLISVVFSLGAVIFAYKWVCIYNKKITLIYACTLFVLFDPLLFIISRQGLGLNLVPFFVFLSLYLITKSIFIAENRSKLSPFEKLTIILAFPSLAFLFLCHYISIISIIPFFVLLIIFFWREFSSQKHLFVFSALFFLVLFTLICFNSIESKSGVFGLNITGFQLSTIKKNLFFIFSGFKEIDRNFNTTTFYNPHLLLLFSPFGFVISGYQFIKKVAPNPQNTVIVFFAISGLVPFVFDEMNLNNSVHLQAILPILSIIGISILFESIEIGQFRRYFKYILVTFLVLKSAVFFIEYFVDFPKYDRKIIQFEASPMSYAISQKGETEKIILSESFKNSFAFELKSSTINPSILTQYADSQNFTEVEASDKSFLAVLTSNEDLAQLNVNKKNTLSISNFRANILNSNSGWQIIRFEKQ